MPLREPADVVNETQQHYVAIGYFFKRNTAALRIERIIFVYRALYDRNECNGERRRSETAK